MSARTRNLIVGIDLDRERPQICYYEKETKNTVAAPMKIGNDDVSFRDIFDRLDRIQDEDGGASEESQDELRILGKKAAGIFRRAFTTLGLNEPSRQIEGIAIAMPSLTRPAVAMIRSVYTELGLEKSHAFLLDYNESFYYHTLYQNRELWSRNVGFFQFSGREVSFLSLSMNQMTRPVTVRTTEGITITLKGSEEEWDEQFCNMIDLSLRQNIYSCIFLQGDTFDRSWAGRSIALMCKGGRKVFVVDNMYARGACYAAREKTVKKILGGYLYMGSDLVRNNIGMNMLIQGKETYYPLLSAGVNWYEAEKECECIAWEEPELDFLVQGMEETDQHGEVMKLDGLPVSERPAGTTRLKMHLYYESQSRCIIEVEDIGFGDLFPSSGLKWRKVLEG